ncbi:MAG: GspE/PulE family protein [Sumerlaeia bacterium]
MAQNKPTGNEPYSNAKKEMENLIRLEAADSLAFEGKLQKREAAKRHRGSRKTTEDRGKEAQNHLVRLGGNEAAARIGQAPVPSMPEMDIEVATDIEPADFIKSMTEKAGLDYANIGDYDLESKSAEIARQLIPSSIARDRRLIPLIEEKKDGRRRNVLWVGISDPLDITIIDDLRLMLPEHELEAVVINEDDIVDAIDRHYGVGEESLDDVINNLDKEDETDDDILKKDDGQVEIDVNELANNPPVIKLVNLLLVQAVQERASDLHIEPFQGQLRIRYRVDGVLREIPNPPKSMQVGMISRLKVMAGMNISESRVPQDGRIRLNISGKEVDMRVASLPTVYGESIVMRVLDKSTMMIGIEQLGFQKEQLEDVLREAKKPNGMLLVTGPTGSGKTTTLYSILNEIFDSGMKFITTEDPVEYELPGIVQVNINTKVGLTFAACLRAILRQDPDDILVGEIRDVETASISIQAALTGHMVFSTLHTNSAAATVTRLVDMGIEPFLLTSTLRGVIGQRLIRTICPSCKEPYIPTDEELAEFTVTREEVEDITFMVGRGCDDCGFSGYKGRIGIYEVLLVTEEVNELILQRATTDEIHALAVHQGMQTMRSDGWLKVCLGITTFDEVSRQTPRESEESARAEMASAKRSLARIDELRRQREAEDNAPADFDEDEFGLPEVSTEGSGGAPHLLPES